MSSEPLAGGEEINRHARRVGRGLHCFFSAGAGYFDEQIPERSSGGCACPDRRLLPEELSQRSKLRSRVRALNEIAGGRGRTLAQIRDALGAARTGERVFGARSTRNVEQLDNSLDAVKKLQIHRCRARWSAKMAIRREGAIDLWRDSPRGERRPRTRFYRRSSRLTGRSCRRRNLARILKQLPALQ